MLHLLQETATHAASSGASSIEVAGAAFVLGAGQFLTWFSSHRKGKNRDTGNTRQMGEIRVAIAGMREEVRDLKAHVIGPDGQNGLRGDVREIRDEVKGILDRERARALQT